MMVSVVNNSAATVPSPMSLNCEDTSSILNLASFKPRRWRDLRPFEKVLVFVVGLVSIISLCLIIVVACLGAKLNKMEGELNTYAQYRSSNSSSSNSSSFTPDKIKGSSTASPNHNIPSSSTNKGSTIIPTKAPSSPTSAPAKSSCSRLCLDEECTVAAGELLRSMDTSYDPCKNFYRYACGNWRETHPIPDSKSRHDQFESLSDKIFRHLHFILESDSDPVSDPEPVQMAQMFYKDCKYQKNENNYTELKHFVDHLMAEFDQDMGRTLGHIRRALGGNFLFTLFVGIDERNTSKHAIYLDQPVFGISRSQLVESLHHENEMVDAYQLFIDEVWHRIFGNDGRANEVASNVVHIEKILATISTPPENRTDKSELYNPHSVQSLHVITEAPDVHISWESYFEEVFFEIYEPEQVRSTWNRTTVIVRDNEFFNELDSVLTGNHTKNMLRDFLTWKIIFALSADISHELRELLFEFNQVHEDELAEEPLWKTCVQQTNQFFGMAMSYHYVHDYFDEENKQEVQLIVDEIKKTLKKTLTTDRELEWMSRATKKVAVEKLDKLEVHIGHPDWLVDGGHPANKTLLISELHDYYYHLLLDKDNDHFENVIEILEWKSREDLKAIRHGRENSNRWLVEPTAVTAQYFPVLNALILPAGVLQPPLYGHYNIHGATSNPLQYLNFGAIGTIISHIMFHAIDQKGSQYHADGSLHNWWDEETNRGYEEKSQCYEKLFSNFKVQNITIPIHWKKTILQESFADNVALHLAFKAYQSYIRSMTNKEEGIKLLPGLPETANQLFFLSHAQMWCSAYRMEDVRDNIKSQAYIPQQFREEGSLINSVEFQKAWSCPPRSPSIEANCKVWS